LIEAVEELRRLRRVPDANDWVVVAAADPRTSPASRDDAPRAPVPNRRLAFRNGVPVAARAGAAAVEWLVELGAADQRHAAQQLTHDPVGARSQPVSSWSRSRGL
jgi:hypothetical protein